MTISTVARIVAPVLLCVAGAALAAPAQDDFQVMGNRAAAISAWRAAVASDIGANLSAPRSSVRAPQEGAVEVSFVADPTGRVGDIAVAQSSGSPALDRAAVIAVTRMGTVRAAPAGVDRSRPVQAWVYFANTEATADRMEARLRHVAARDLAADDRPIVLRARG